MKRIRCAALLTVCLLFFCATAEAYNYGRVNLVVDGNPIDEMGVVAGERTLAPVRAVGEALGATINWDGATQEVQIKKMIVSLHQSSNTVRYEDRIVTLRIGDTKLKINGVYVGELDVPAQIIDGKTMVPVRAVSEVFDAVVEWNGAEQTVIITPAWNDSVQDAINQQQVTENEVIENFTSEPIKDQEAVLAEWISIYDLRQADLTIWDAGGIGGNGIYRQPQYSMFITESSPVYAMPDLPNHFTSNPKNGMYSGIEFKVVNGVPYIKQDSLIKTGLLGNLRFYLN